MEELALVLVIAVPGSNSHVCGLEASSCPMVREISRKQSERVCELEAGGHREEGEESMKQSARMCELDGKEVKDWETDTIP